MLLGTMLLVSLYFGVSYLLLPRIVSSLVS